MSRVLRLPDHGRLIVCTDLQGCLRDFDRIVELYRGARLETDGDAHILFTGDLVHGPHIDPEDWPDFLGEYYRDQSGEVVWLDDQHVGGFAIGHFLQNDRRGVEDEVNVLPTTTTERFSNFEQRRPERGVGEHLEPCLQVRRYRFGQHRHERKTH